ncbi:MAG TPA: alpha/beta hydrolase-fold protein [Candidatus Andersenbacteria bacterium]|nr:alpha/beta hydrolase-fold protein [Candidatus Andersenbacteria bacterium]
MKNNLCIAGMTILFFFQALATQCSELISITTHEQGRECPLIIQLKEQMMGCADFWREVEQRGTPLIDFIEGSDSETLVTFIWRATREHGNVVVASYGLCSFDPVKNRMTHIPNTDVWYKSWILPRNTRTVYSISPDDPLIAISDYRLDQCFSLSFNHNWVHDPLNSKKYVIPGALCAGGIDRNMSLLEMPDAPSFPWKNEEYYPKGSVINAYVPSQILEEGRAIYVYLPPNYDASQITAYPLVIAFDGYIYKDFIEAPLIFDYLIAKGKLPPLIAVMIENPAPNFVTRFRDLACHEPFMDFIAYELVPWVQSAYRATVDPRLTVLAGGSLGAVIATYMGLDHPEIFGNVIAQTGTYWWPIRDTQNWLIEQYVQSPTRDVRFFLDVGSLETVPTFANGSSQLNSNRHFRDVLKAKGYPVKYVEYAGGHDFVCLQHTFAEGLQYLLNRK